MDKNNFRINVFEKAAYCRHFEEQVIKNIKSKNIKIPTYVSAGQEFISATIATICESINVRPLLFGQHRCHSIYLSLIFVVSYVTGERMAFATYAMGLFFLLIFLKGYRKSIFFSILLGLFALFIIILN